VSPEQATWRPRASAGASPAAVEPVKSDLIYDIGFHRGEDTDFYLKKGYRVVAVEANPELCAEGRERFAGPISEGRLTLVNKAVAEAPGKVTFYRNRNNSVWGTIDLLWAERNARMGSPSDEIIVEATTMEALLAEFGVPYYAKFDIEGFDMVGVQGLGAAKERPRYISVESDKDSFKALLREFAILTSLGYDRFKVVPQSKVPRQRCADLDYQFPEGSSGQLGEDAPGSWLTAEQAIAAYKPIFFRYALVGDDPVAPQWARSLAWRLGMRADWYDTHAKISDPDRSPAHAPPKWQDEAAHPV
jgi:FkbM family methyltransferase